MADNENRDDLFPEPMIPLWQKVRDLEELERRHGQTLQLLQESEELYRAVVENVADGIAITVGTNRAFVNRAFLEIHGLKSVSEVIGLPLDQFILHEDRDAVRKRSLARQEGRLTEHIFEYRIKRPDGEVRWVQSSAVKTIYKGEPAVLAVLRDITKLKAAEEEIRMLNRKLERHVQELKDSNEELEAFNYMVSHDLKLPLIAIEGFSRRMEKTCLNGPTEKCRNYIGIIQDSARKMDQLIRDLLDYCRIGRGELQRTRIDMTALAKSIIEELRRVDPGRSMIATVGNLSEAWGDPAMIRQVLLNLLSNAFKFTRHRDQAIIEMASVDTDEVNTYSVKDNGSGFEARHAQTLFGLFQRLHGSDEFEGTGVGLAVVKRIVERHGGRVWAEGETDKGATFYFTLPKTGE
ncbi:MAG: Phytochrome-like protein cph1 [Syntrophorhabdaceae bacterium PtaU1.Bin034]|nr:MAG: Phytochrome-like protein cph1 [Syntrophorhabdaceae bacterium PtaU1.Bin034]